MELTHAFGIAPRSPTLDPLPQDIEIELEPCYGLSGLIRSRAVSIAFEPGKPNSQDG